MAGIQRTSGRRCWKLFNTQLFQGKKFVFPVVQLDREDIWQYIRKENIEIPSLYFAKERPVVERDGNLIMVDDDRMRFAAGRETANA